VEGVFVDAQAVRSCLAEGLSEREGFGVDTVMMLPVDLFPERLGAVAPGQDAGEPGNEAFLAGKTKKPSGVDDEA
jgi:hypothetical protein